MKKIMMGLAALIATSYAVPAFADDAKPADDAAVKPAKKHKGHKKEKKADDAAKPAGDAPAAK